MAEYDVTNFNVICRYQNLPIRWTGDVIVAGGGPGGLGAAIAAHRSGAKTILIEKNGFLGGMMSYGCGMPLGGAYPGMKSIGGIAEELLSLVRNAGQDAADVRHIPLFGDWYFHDSEFFKSLIAEFVLKEKMEVLLHSFVSDVIMDSKRRVKGIVIDSKSGREVLIGKTIVDATGDADICTRAGAHYEVGDEHGDLMGVTIPYILADVDTEKYLKYIAEDKDFSKLRAKAKADGIFTNEDDKFGSHHLGQRPNTVFVNSVRVRNINGTKVEELTFGELESRVRMLQHLNFFRKYVPGFEKCYIASSGAEIGVRDSRRIIGEDYLTQEDCLEVRKQPDKTILRCQGPFDDISRGKRTDVSFNQVDVNDYYDIPYGVLVPKDLDNVIVSGRTFSSNPRAQAGSRGQGLLLGMGQAAGTAAVMAAREGAAFKDINIKALQKQLVEAGCDLGI
ncbi:membrane protein [Spirochaetia bacterium]|nr:membrane protein [Spirochaetia bacterium]